MDANERQPLGFSQVLRRTGGIFFSRFPALLGIIVVPPLFLTVMAWVMFLVLMPVVFGTSQVNVREMWMHLGAWKKASVVLCFLTSIWVLWLACAATIFAASEAILGRSLGPLGAYRRIRPVHLRFLGLLLLTNLVGALGPTAIVSIALGIWLLPALPIALLEQQNISQALKRSEMLTKGGYGRIIALLIVYIPVVAIAIGLAFTLIDILSQIGAVATRLGAPVAFLILSFAPQLLMIALTVSYHDQRAHKEHWTPETAATQ